MAGNDRYADQRRAALGYLLQAEETVAEAYARGVDEWLDSVRGHVFSGSGLGRLIDPLGIFSSARRFASALVRPVVGAVEAVIAAAFTRAVPGVEFRSRPWVQQHLAEVGNHLQAVPDWLFAKVTSELQAGQLQGDSITEMAARVEQTLLDGNAEVWRGRARVVARTEALSAYNGGTDQAMRAMADEFGFELEKVWLASMDARTRDTHFIADGQRVPLDGLFNVGGFLTPLPGAEVLPPEERISCRCSVLYVEPGEETDMSNRGFRGDEAEVLEVRRRRRRGIVRDRDR